MGRDKSSTGAEQSYGAGQTVGATEDESTQGRKVAGPRGPLDPLDKSTEQCPDTQPPEGVASAKESAGEVYFFCMHCRQPSNRLESSKRHCRRDHLCSGNHPKHVGQELRTVVTLDYVTILVAGLSLKPSGMFYCRHGGCGERQKIGSKIRMHCQTVHNCSGAHSGSP